ncbi:MAG: sensor histidine kinase [Vicingaceae bacterium]
MKAATIILIILCALCLTPVAQERVSELGKNDTVDWVDFERRFDSLYQLIHEDREAILPKFEALRVQPGVVLDTSVYSEYLLKLGSAFLRKGDYSEATRTYTQALRLKELTKDQIGISKSYLCLANVFYYTNNYPKSIEYLESAERMLRTIELSETKQFLVGTLFNTYGLIYYELDSNDIAIDYFEKAISVDDGDLVYRDNLAMVYEFIGDYQKAADQYERSLKGYFADSSVYDIAWNAYHLAKAYTSLKDEEKSKYYLKMAKKFSPKANSIEIQMEIAYAETKHHIIFGNLDSAYRSLFNYSLRIDDLMERRAEELQYEIEGKYQLEKKENALQLSKESEARLEAQNRTQKIVIGLSIVLLLILGVVLALSFRFYKQKRRINEMELSIKDSKLDELLSSQESSVLAAIVKGQNEERERVAKELHDRLGGTLAALKMSLKQKSGQLSGEEMDIVNEAVKEVRSISHNLSTGVAQQFGFNQAVELLVERMKGSTSIQFELFLHKDIAKLGQSTGIELYRIVQELLANTLKHANATEVSLQTNFNDGVFNLIYEDNGRGFDTKSTKAEKGIGLYNIKQRVESIGGHLNIDSMPKRGTIVIVDIDKKGTA